MQVGAFSTPLNPRWRWRIVNDAGEVVEESNESFPTIARAVTQGTARLGPMNAVDHWMANSTSGMPTVRLTRRSGSRRPFPRTPCI